MHSRLWTLTALAAGMLLVAPREVSAQQVGPSLELYPAGAIVTARYSRDLPQNRRLHLHAGMNATDRRDWGEHADENGAGFGFGVAGHQYRNPERTGAWLGLRTDLWFMTIDWLDSEARGSSDVVVLQPTLRAGWTVETGRILLDFSAGFGAEVNVQTTGESVGQGAILLVGFALSL